MTGVPGHLYPPPGRCIYCGDTTSPLTREHIIPLSFGGNLLFAEASCKSCAHLINLEIENPIARQEWGAFRVKRNFPSRNKKRQKTDIGIEGHGGSKLNIPIANHSTPVPLYKFSEARILSGLPEGLGDDKRWTMVMLCSHDEEMAMQKRYPQWNRVHKIRAQPHRFARLLAKIAHGYATAELGISSFRPLVIDLILGRSDDYYYTVGGSFDIGPPVPGGDHITDISMRFVRAGVALVVVDIRLFSATETPSYHVVVGEIDLRIPEHFRAFEAHRTAGKITPLPLKI